MQNILAQIGRFFEEHVEKIVLVVAGVVSLWILGFFVLRSPNTIELDNKKFAPGQVDTYIFNEKAAAVVAQLERPPAPKGRYQSPLTGYIDANDAILGELKGPLDHGFSGLFACAISNVSSEYYPPLPHVSSAQKTDDREYNLPTIGEVADVKVDHIRAAAYFPVEPLTESTTYQSAQHEPNNLDLVTVQGRFDLKTLRARFHESFASENLPAAWRDESLAKPVFAAVNLQRQQYLGNGRWSDWQDVPRASIENPNPLLHMVEDARDLPSGGVRVRLLQLNKPDIQSKILQPRPYEIASQYEEWLPPEFHQRYIDILQRERAQKRREERDQERESRNRDNDRRNDRRSGRLGQQGGRGGAGRGMDMLGMGNTNSRRTRGRGRATGRNDAQNMLPGLGGVNDRTRRTRGRGNDRMDMGADAMGYGAMGMGRGMGTAVGQSPELLEIIQKFADIVLTPDKNLSRMDEVVFWAYDDTTEPDHLYQYRVRVGVLNPVAGTGNISEQDASFANKAILWSDFSSVTPEVDIPARMNFFATNYQAVADSVSVEVAKFELGYWRSETFAVKPGETIGREVEIEPEEDQENRTVVMDRGMFNPMTQEENEPEIVDFSTGITFVGASRVDGWTGGSTLHPQIYYEMLYSDDGTEIARMPVGSRFWPDRVSTAYGQIRKLQKEPEEDFRNFGSSATSVYFESGFGAFDRGGYSGALGP